jgi:radical SAM superfamily enzyme YgiQ (UPF0313 family)
MRICFIFSSYNLTSGKLAKGKKIWIHGLALPLLAAYAGKEHSVTLINDYVQPLPDKNSFDVFFISIMGSVLDRAREIIKTLKTDNNYIIVGGKTLNETTSDYAPLADAIAYGEGETLIDQILTDIKNNCLKKQYGDPLLRTSLENLPIPRYDLIDKKTHASVYPVEATRGCENRCSFCYIHSWSKGIFRKRPVEQVIRDIAYIKKLKVRHIMFVDDNLFSDREYALDLFKAMIPLKIKWFSQITAGATLDEELIKTAAASGLMGLTIGFESMTKESLDKVNKPNDPDMYVKGIANLNRFGIYSFPLFVAGINENTTEEFKKIYSFCLESRVTAPLLYVLTPIPGTRLYDEYYTSGKLVDYDLSHYNLFHVVIKLEDNFESTYWRSYKSFYSVKNILIRVFLKKGNPIQKIIAMGINFFIKANISKRPIHFRRQSLFRKDK